MSDGLKEAGEGNQPTTTECRRADPKHLEPKSEHQGGKPIDLGGEAKPLDTKSIHLGGEAINPEDE